MAKGHSCEAMFCEWDLCPQAAPETLARRAPCQLRGAHKPAAVWLGVEGHMLWTRPRGPRSPPALLEASNAS